MPYREDAYELVNQLNSLRTGIGAYREMES